MRLVSVIMCIYNENERLICEAIESILNQSYKDFEFIIVIDNPEHSTVDSALSRFNDVRIKVIRNENNIGLALSLNKAVEQSEGNYLVRMDADDISEKNRIETMIGYLNANHDCGLVCSNAYEIDEDGNDLVSNFYVPADDRCLEKSLDYGSIMIHPTVVMRRKAFEICGGYNDYLAAQDYDLWLRMRTKGIKMHYIDEKLLRYRRRKSSTTNEKSLIQCLSAQYARKVYMRKECFSREKYMSYIQEKLSNPGYVNEYESFMKAKEFGRIIDYFIFLRGIIFNNSCRYKMLKNLYFRKLCDSEVS